MTGNLTAGEKGTNWMHEMGGSSAQVTCYDDDFCDKYLLKDVVVIIIIVNHSFDLI